MAGVPATTSGVSTSGLNYLPVTQPMAQPQLITNANNPPTDASGGLGSLLGGVLGTAANVYGAQNAAENISRAETAGINTQTQTLGNINSLFKPQTTLGNSAMSTLGSTLGVNGKPADYSNFLNMPGYQFAVDQGTRAIQRQASASGSAYTPNTGAAIGQYVTGTAMQDYNTYISQLMGAAGLGAQANNTLTGANLQVGGNISQMLQNGGMAQASGVSNTAGSFLGNYGGNGSGVNNLFNTGRQLYNYGSKAYNYLTGSGAPSDVQGIYGAIDSGTAATSATAGVGAGYGMLPDGTVDTSTFFNPDVASSLGDYGGDAASFSEAGAGSATAAGSSESAAASAVPEVGAGVAAAGMGAMLAIAAHQNPTALSQHYWDSLNTSLAAGPGTDKSNWGASNALQPIQQHTDYYGALAALADAYRGQGQGNSVIPDSEWATLAQYGITPQNIGNLSMPDMGQAYWDSLSASTGVPEYSTPSRQGL